MWNEDREKFRNEMTHLLTDAKNHLEFTPSTSALVTEFIENYEFGLAYEFIIGELREKNMPAGDAAPSLKAAASIMGIENSN
jgi:hypothetical protein